MTIGFAIGNGNSRKGIELERLAKVGKIYGCNAIYRDYTPEVLVAVDGPIATAIENSGYAQEHRFYTRRPTQGGLPVPTKYYGYSSGPISIAIAAEECEIVFLVGHDFGTKNAPSSVPTREEIKARQKNKNRSNHHVLKFNNIYADTEFYKRSTESATFGGNWIKQTRQVCVDHPKVQFYRVENAHSAKVEFPGVSNIELIDFQTFFKVLNTLRGKMGNGII